MNLKDCTIYGNLKIQDDNISNGGDASLNFVYPTKELLHSEKELNSKLPYAPIIHKHKKKAPYRNFSLEDKSLRVIIKNAKSL